MFLNSLVPPFLDVMMYPLLDHFIVEKVYGTKSPTGNFSEKTTEKINIF